MSNNLFKNNISRNTKFNLIKKEEKKWDENNINPLNNIESEENNSIISITQLIQSNNDSLKSSRDSKRK